MSKIDETYHGLLEHILDKGFWYNDMRRAGVKRQQISSYRIEHDLTESFPAISTKKLAWKSMTSELMWFLKGDSNIKYLLEHNNPIWNKDAYAHYVKSHMINKPVFVPVTMDMFLYKASKSHVSKIVPSYTYGNLGPVYGHLWRTWQGSHGNVTYIDQIGTILHSMMKTPMSTEHIVTAWDPSVTDKQALPPCHFGFQVMMRPLTHLERFDLLDRSMRAKGIKSFDALDFDAANVPAFGFELVWQQRSVDVFLGLPFNIASYGLLAHIIGRLTNTVPLKLIGDLRNVHLYDNSIAAAKEQLTRDTNSEPAKLLMKDEFHDICDEESIMRTHIIDKVLRPDMFKLYGYNPDPGIKVEMLART